MLKIPESPYWVHEVTSYCSLYHLSKIYNHNKGGLLGSPTKHSPYKNLNQNKHSFLDETPFNQPHLGHQFQIDYHKGLIENKKYAVQTNRNDGLRRYFGSVPEIGIQELKQINSVSNSIFLTPRTLRNQNSLCIAPLEVTQLVLNGHRVGANKEVTNSNRKPKQQTNVAEEVYRFNLQNSINETEMKSQQLITSIQETKMQISKLTEEKERLNAQENHLKLRRKEQFIDVLKQLVSSSTSRRFRNNVELDRLALRSNISHDKTNTESTRTPIENLRIDVNTYGENKVREFNPASEKILLRAASIDQASTVISPLVKNRNYRANLRSNTITFDNQQNFFRSQHQSANSQANISNTQIKVKRHARDNYSGLRNEHSLHLFFIKYLKYYLGQTLQHQSRSLNSTKINGEDSKIEFNASKTRIKQSDTENKIQNAFNSLAKRFQKVMDNYQNLERQQILQNKTLLKKLDLLLSHKNYLATSSPPLHDMS